MTPSATVFVCIDHIAISTRPPFSLPKKLRAFLTTEIVLLTHFASVFQAGTDESTENPE
jgi:hypothetical protein